MPPNETQPTSTLTTVRNITVGTAVVVLLVLLVAYIWGPQLLRGPQTAEQENDRDFGIATDITSLSGRVTEIGNGYFVLGLENIPPNMDVSLTNRRIIITPELVVERMRLRSDADRESELRAFYAALDMPFDGAVASSLPPGFAIDPETDNAYPSADLGAGAVAIEEVATGTGEIEVPPVPSRYVYEPVTVTDLRVGMEVAVVASQEIFYVPTITPQKIVIQSD